MAINASSLGDSEQKEISLDETIKEMEQWRQNKTNRGQRIPEEIYSKIIELSNKFSPSKICGLFGLSGAQLKKKIEESQAQEQTANPLGDNTKTAKVEFQEVECNGPPMLTASDVREFAAKKDNSVEFPKNISHPKLTLSQNTMVVELFSGNRKMALHLTLESLQDLVNAFYPEEH